MPWRRRLLAVCAMAPGSLAPRISHSPALSLSARPGAEPDHGPRVQEFDRRVLPPLPHHLWPSVRELLCLDDSPLLPCTHHPAADHPHPHRDPRCGRGPCSRCDPAAASSLPPQPCAMLFPLNPPSRPPSLPLVCTPLPTDDFLLTWIYHRLCRTVTTYHAKTFFTPTAYLIAR